MINFPGFRVRRAMRKQKGGEISVPVMQSNKQLKQSIHEGIESGKFNIGEPVIEREITKLAINAQGEIEQKKCHLQARKIPFQDIRKEALIKNKNLLRIKNDAFYEELSESEIRAELEKISEDVRGTHDEIKQRLKSFQWKRHWLIWHDHSTLSNYGHMLFCVREMYDPAIHFSDAEARVQYGKDVDVQATVERHYLYMLGQSSSSIEDQIEFVPARHDD